MAIQYAPFWTRQMFQAIADGEFDEVSARDFGLECGEDPWRVSRRDFMDAALDAGMDHSWAEECFAAFKFAAEGMSDPHAVAEREIRNQMVRSPFIEDSGNESGETNRSDETSRMETNSQGNFVAEIV